MGGREDSEQQQQTHAEQRKRSREEAGAREGRGVREYKQKHNNKAKEGCPSFACEQGIGAAVWNKKCEAGSGKKGQGGNHGEENKNKTKMHDETVHSRSDKDSAAEHRVNCRERS
jgi:hypothetical protein